MWEERGAKDGLVLVLALVLVRPVKRVIRNVGNGHGDGDVAAGLAMDRSCVR